MKFTSAMSLLRQGCAVSRQGWSAGVWLVLQENILFLRQAGKPSKIWVATAADIAAEDWQKEIYIIPTERERSAFPEEPEEFTG